MRLTIKRFRVLEAQHMIGAEERPAGSNGYALRANLQGLHS